jgi:hypothetical protein
MPLSRKFWNWKGNSRDFFYFWRFLFGEVAQLVRAQDS